MSKRSPILAESWPDLPLAAWEDTRATLHLWMQIPGKVCLALTPLANHYWNTTFRYAPRGLSLPLISAKARAFTIGFDFVEHRVVLEFSDGVTRSLPLGPQTVAEFCRAFMNVLEEEGVKAHIWTMPVEVADPIRFEEDTTHRSYDPKYVSAFWRILLDVKPVFEEFRAGFLGKCSPLHFFWGGFDLALTRFSGRRAPERPDADAMTRESYSHEVISHGFWPGGSGVSEPAFYAYAAPEPEGFEKAKVLPSASYYHGDLGMFILPYEAVRNSSQRSRDLLAFLDTTYDAAATLANWNRTELERR
jgi:uncharacterized protein DUF5996